MQKEISNMFLIKIQVYFYTEKNFKSVFNENTDVFCMQKNTHLYLMKIQICFVCRKKFQFVFNENTNLFFFFLLKKKWFQQSIANLEILRRIES